jgi:hypothetical protein
MERPHHPKVSLVDGQHGLNIQALSNRYNACVNKINFAVGILLD